jgi:hypothetical protein
VAAEVGSVKPADQAVELVTRVMHASGSDESNRKAVAHEIVRELTGAGLIADRDDLLAAVDMASRHLRGYTERGHPGRPCRRTAWASETWLDAEREALRGIQGRL